MLGSGSNNHEDTQEFLAQLEACQDEMDAALSRSEFSAVIEKDNFFGTQFHPEKSGLAGERILKSFVSL